MNKRAYSRLERDGNGVIRVVFYDAETSLPVTDLTGYSIVALDEQGQALPVNSAPTPNAPIPASQAALPTLSEPVHTQAVQERDGIGPQIGQKPQGMGEGGEVAKMDLEPTGRFVGPGGLVGLALGDENNATNTGWRNSLLTGGLGLAASTLVGGPAGLAVGLAAKGVVNSDKFKDNYNDRGQLSGIGVGMGRPKAPEGPKTDAVGLGVYPDTASQISNPTPVDNVNQQNTQSIGQQRTNIPGSSPPIDGGYPKADMRQAPSMSAFNRREPTAGTYGTVDTFDRTGLSPSISKVVDRVNQAVPGTGINSAYRDPGKNAAVGGAKNSMHTRGEAVDINTTGWSNEQKRDALEAAVQGGARGVGIYPSGNSIHIDTRREPTTWGPNGYRGSPVESMPEWSRDTLSAMYGAGPDGQVGPRVGPTPKSREQALSESPIKGSPLTTSAAPTTQTRDLAFASRPDFGSMTPGQIASSGFGKKPSDAQIDAMAYTLAGELSPDAMSNPKAISNLTATLQNRIESVGYKATFDPGQYNSLSPQNRPTTERNYSKYGESIKQGIRDYYDGKNVPDVPDATHYYNPDIANPAWGGSLKNSVLDSGHRIGTIPGEYTQSPGAMAKSRREAEDNFTNQALAVQAGRNVDNIDKNIGGMARTSVASAARTQAKAEAREAASEPGSLEGSRYSGVGLPSSSSSGPSKSKGFAGKEKDDNVGSSKSSGNKSSSSSSSKSSSSSSKGFAGKEKDDNVGSSAKSSSSSKSSAKGGVSSSSAAKSGDGFASRNGSSNNSSSSKSSGGLNTSNAKGMSERSKDDNDSKSSSSKSSSSSSGGGKKK